MTHKQYLTTKSATILALNSMIGAGIFSMPQALYGVAGPLGLVTIVFIAVTVWCLAYTLGKIAEQHPHAASLYDYIVPWGGSRLATLVISLYYAGMVVAMGLLTRALGYELYAVVSYGTPALWSLVMLVAITWLVAKGVELSIVGQYVLAITTMVPIFIISVLCLFEGHIANLSPFAPHGWLAAMSASKIVIFGYFGLECVTSLAPYLRNPRRTLPLVLTLSISIVSVLYFVFIFSTMVAVPQALLASSATSLSSALMSVFPHYRWLLGIVSLGIASAITGTIHAMLWSATSLMAPTAYYSGAKTRVRGLIVTSLCILVACWLIRHVTLFFSLVALLVVPTYFIVIATVFCSRHRYDRLTQLCGIVGWLASFIITASALSALFG